MNTKCGSCSRKNIIQNEEYYLNIILNGNFNNRQLIARLEYYKKKFCTFCNKRYDCDIVNLKKCKGNK